MQSILLDSIRFHTLAGLVHTGNQHRKIGVGIIPLELCIGLCMGRKERNPCSRMSLGKSVQENLSLWSIVCYMLLPCCHLQLSSQAFEMCRTYKNKIRLLNRDILSLYLYFTARSCLSWQIKWITYFSSLQSFLKLEATSDLWQVQQQNDPVKQLKPENEEQSFFH